MTKKQQANQLPGSHLKKFILSTVKTGITLPDRPIKVSHDIGMILHDLHQVEGNDFQEFFYILFLNRSNKVTGYYLASMGGMTGTVADPRLIIKTAILANCCSLILCHNHPSGSIKPSRADEQLTEKIKNAARFIDITVLDHVILGENNSYFSFADEGLI